MAEKLKFLKYVLFNTKFELHSYLSNNKLLQISTLEGTNSIKSQEVKRGDSLEFCNKQMT